MGEVIVRQLYFHRTTAKSSVLLTPTINKNGTAKAAPFLVYRSYGSLVRGPLDLAEVDAFLDHLVERGEFAEVLDDVDDLVADVVDLGLGVEAAQAEADGASARRRRRGRAP